MRVKGKEDIKRDLWGRARTKCRKDSDGAGAREKEDVRGDRTGLNEDRQLLSLR